ncbi:hypothetical protein O0L34_g10231 [Tuta absoluta]|nr:hypothetical protein O0L34_g10231 [Tuta absoluta]
MKQSCVFWKLLEQQQWTDLLAWKYHWCLSSHQRQQWRLNYLLQPSRPLQSSRSPSTQFPRQDQYTKQAHLQLTLRRELAVHLQLGPRRELAAHLQLALRRELAAHLRLALQVWDH